MSKADQDFPTRAQLLKENERLRARLDKAKQTIQTIRNSKAKSSTRPVQSPRKQPAQVEQRNESKGSIDTSRHKKAEAETRRLLNAVQVEKDRLSALVNNISDEVWFADSDKKFTLANPAALQTFGIDPGDAVDVEKFAASLEVFRPDGSPRPINEAPPLRALRGETVKNQEETVRIPTSGELRTREVSAIPVRGLHGQIIGAISVVRDITERKQAEEALARSNAMLTEVLDSIQDDFYVLDRDWKFVYASRSFTAKIGKEPKDFIGNCIWDMFPKHTGTILEENFRASMEKGEVRRFELGGKYTTAWYSMTSFPSAEGITVLGKDITASRQAEEDLRLSDERFRLALKNAPVSVATQDRDLHFQWAFNQRTLPVEQILGKTDFDLFPPKDAERLVALKRKVLQTGKEVRKNLWITSGGKRLYLDLLLEPLRDNDGNVTGVGIATIDLTPIKRAEEDLLRLNRTLRALSNINQAMMRTTDEAGFMNDVCQIVVKDCGHAMVWIGLAEQDDGKTVRPVAHAGFEKGYLESLNITWADTERGRGPTGTAIRTGQMSTCRNMLTDPKFKPWREEALKRGYAASIVLPLMSEGRAFGAISIYSREPDPFTEADVELLEELAGDLAYGISMLRIRLAHAQAQEALEESEARYRSLFNSMTEGFALHEIICDEKGIPL